MDKKKNILEIFEKLRIWRNEEAQKKGVEPFMIFRNETLMLTATAFPDTKQGLKDIKGWGPKKITKYGDKILELLQNIDKVEPSNPNSSKNAMSVKEFIELINKTIYQVGFVKVLGEINDLSVRNLSAYFQIKDSKSEEGYVVNCFLGWKNYEKLSHLLELGGEVIIYGRPNIYKKGQFNLLVENIEPIGAGALKKAFEALKKKLHAKGYFASERKQQLPDFIRKIGLITSQTGQAVHDFRKNLGNYGFNVYLKDVFVEGEKAEESIVQAIQWFNKNYLDIDILVLIRGGGGIENLKAFNSESIADAIVLSKIPIITGIGHEQDVSIADFTADKAFSTPTKTAVFIKNRHEDLLSEVDLLLQNMNFNAFKLFDREKYKISQISKQIVVLFSKKITEHKFILTNVFEKMLAGLNKVFFEFKALEQRFSKLFYKYQSSIQQQFHVLDTLRQKSINMLKDKYNKINRQIEINKTALVSLDPKAVLKRGYSIVYDKNNKIIKNSFNVKLNQKIFTRLYKGKIISKIKKIKK